ncbi:hypothetical protein AB0F17_08815 [Nonomuraea sp. NPDC026600]
MTATERYNRRVEAGFLLARILRAIDDALEFAADMAATPIPTI